MLRTNARLRALLFSGAALVLIVVLVVVLAGGGGHTSEASARSAAQTAAAMPQLGPPALARYREGSPHVASRLSVYSAEGAVQGAPTTPPDELPPVSPSSFSAPVAAYKAYSTQRLHLMQGEIAKLETALAANDRAAGQAAWRGAYAYYLNLGAVYLEGPIADLNDAIDGTPGGVPGGVSSSQFSGLHRLERGLWTGAPLVSLEPWVRKLSVDVAKLAKMVPSVQIDPLDYATRAHEILEDAVRDQLSGTDAPWSGAGVLGTSAGVVATTEVVRDPGAGTRDSRGRAPDGGLRPLGIAIDALVDHRCPWRIAACHVATHAARIRATGWIPRPGARGAGSDAGGPGDDARAQPFLRSRPLRRRSTREPP